MGRRTNHDVRRTRICSRGRSRVVAESLLTQREAATLAGCSKDTIIRARRAGRFPHACLRGQAWMVPVDDLVAVGMYDPEQRTVRVEGSGATEWDGSGEVELVRALARIAALEDIVARQDEELRFLRDLMASGVGRTGSR
jgi:hypothetical protein